MQYPVITHSMICTIKIDMCDVLMQFGWMQDSSSSSGAIHNLSFNYLRHDPPLPSPVILITLIVKENKIPSGQIQMIY